jgi:hypothetical protein
VQNNTHNGGMQKLSRFWLLIYLFHIVKKEKLKKEIFHILEDCDKEIVLTNYNVFKALIFQKIVYPELIHK